MEENQTMKYLMILAVLISFGCATTGGGKAQKVEFTAKQNWINLGITVIGAGLTGLAYYGASKKMGEDVKDALERESVSIPTTIKVVW